MINTPKIKPNYTIHRYVTGAPVTADSAVLTTLPLSGALKTKGYNTINCVVKLGGGTTPTATLQLLERILWTDTGGTDHEEYIELAAAGSAKSDGDVETFTTGGGDIFLRIDAVSGSPTSVTLLVAKATLV